MQGWGRTGFISAPRGSRSSPDSQLASGIGSVQRISLRFVKPFGLKERALFSRFDPFGDEREIEVSAEHDDGTYYAASGFAVRQSACEPVDSRL